MITSRRGFLRTSLESSTMLSLGTLTVPTFLARSAAGAAPAAGKGERALVVIQMLGGNDGLNTVVPHKHDGYLRARRALRLPGGSLHKLSDELALHPGMGQMAGLVEKGRLAIVQGVGYPNPDRSHFRSMEIWETARTEAGAVDTGWLGRVLDARPAAPGSDLPALNVGSHKPLALLARTTEAPSIETLEAFRLQLSGGEREQQAGRARLDAMARLERPTDDPLLGFVTRSAVAALDSSRKLEEIAAKAPAAESGYPNYALARRLHLVSQLLKAGYGTRIYYTSLDGFDTHANQLAAHAGLLTELSDSVAAFVNDLEKAGLADRVAVVCFSEFGRRVAENASAGTDHGAGAPVFVAGPVTQRGLVGAHPSLDDLDDGDLKFHTDFRRVYASLLDSWLGVPAAEILGPGFSPLDLLPRQA